MDAKGQKGKYTARSVIIYIFLQIGAKLLTYFLYFWHRILWRISTTFKLSYCELGDNLIV